MKLLKRFWVMAFLCLASLAAGPAFAQHAPSQGNQSAPPAWEVGDPAARVAEVAVIASTVIATHPRGHTLATNPAWAAALEELEVAAEGGSQAQYLISLMGLLAVLEDGHTTVPIGFSLEHGLFPQRLPLSFGVFDDGLFVTAAKDEAAPLLGGRVVRLGNEPVADVLERFAAIWPGDNVAWAYHDLGLLGLPVLLSGLGVMENTDDPVSIAVELGDGTLVEATLTPRHDGNIERVALDRTLFPRQQWGETAREPNFVQRLPEHQTIYVRLATVTSSETLSMRDFTGQVQTVMAEPGYDRLVLDLRDNSGGNNILAERMRRAIMLSKYNVPGSLYVLIAPQTFSAAMNVASRFERDTYALFVGEPTGASPNSYGDHSFQILEEAGLGYMISTLPWFDSMPMDERQWIMPDVLAPSTFADWVAGQDAGLEAAIAHENTREMDESDWFIPWQRASQGETWEPFWRR